MEEELPEDRLNEKYLNNDNSTSEKNTNMPKFLLRLFFRHYRAKKACEAAILDYETLKYIKEY